MPIRNQIEPISDILRDFSTDFKYTTRRGPRYYYKPKNSEFWHADRVIIFDTAGCIIVSLKYQGRLDKITYFPLRRYVQVSTERTEFGMNHVFFERFPMTFSEEEFFQESLLSNFMNNEFHDFVKIQELFSHYEAMTKEKLK